MLQLVTFSNLQPFSTVVFKSDSPHTASALDTASHNGFDERANVLVFHSSFALCEAAPVTAKLHGLVLHTEWFAVLLINLTNKTMSIIYEIKLIYSCKYDEHIYSESGDF